MGAFKNLGDPALALAEECSEAIKIIAKKYRFNGNWSDIPPETDLTRWEQLKGEMDDIMYQWERLKTLVDATEVHHDKS